MRMSVLGYAAASVLSLAACNTVTRGTNEIVTITTSPASARIWTSLGHECPRSPCAVKVDRKVEFTAYAQARGYRQGSVLVKAVLTEQAAPGVLGNAILPGGSVGLVLDAADGAMLDHRPNPAQIDLVPVRRAGPS
ncbi:translation initiation factor 2 [Microvirga puerhi]|uniref:Translation initiation factor 2 n=1 Tax=Microvirga puerhi TaxID=2876078 RepID=A0ABS7VM23_9HYPH|nr:translation initiation factor 2 [Microvirga puerhi]MBZ6076195.1 translation initiation factor 2 [Microvirga puerhi]